MVFPTQLGERLIISSTVASPSGPGSNHYGVDHFILYGGDGPRSLTTDQSHSVNQSLFMSALAGAGGEDTKLLTNAAEQVA